MNDRSADREAARRVVEVERLLSPAALRLAFHAAVPVAVDPDFLHLLRINFFLNPPDELPYCTEAKLLLSPLFREIDDGLYEIDRTLRHLLLAGLEQRYGSDRARQVASLLAQYAERTSSWADRPELERAQQLTALSFLDPVRAVAWLEQANSPGGVGDLRPEWFVAMRRRLKRPPRDATLLDERLALARRQLAAADERLDVRLDRIQTLEELALYPEVAIADITEILVEYVRLHTPRPPGNGEPHPPLLALRAPDVQRAMTALGRLRHDAASRRGLRLRGIDLRGADLTGADLREADLTSVILRGARLSGANLDRAMLAEADLEGVDLSGTHLMEAKLSGASLARADLSGTDLRAASLLAADLTEARLLNARLSGADLRHARLDRADLRGAQLDGVSLEAASADLATTWPVGMDPLAAGVMLKPEETALGAEAEAFAQVDVSTGPVTSGMAESRRDNPDAVMSRRPAAIMSYVRFDDEYEGGRLTQFRERLSAEIRIQTGEDFPIFQDRNDIAWGQNWRARIDENLDAVTLLIPILTPRFFRSPVCREELTRFLERERRLGREDLILPVYYVSTPELDDPARREGDELARALAARQYADWRELRFEPFTSPVVRKAMMQLASRMRDSFRHPTPRRATDAAAKREPRTQRTAHNGAVELVPDVDYAAVAADALADHVEPDELGRRLSSAWAEAYRSRLPQSSLLEFDSDGARFLFDLASAAGAQRADRTVAAWGRSRPAPRPRDQAYQRGYPSPQGRADRPLDKGHMVAHAAGGTFGPNMFPQDRELNRGWSVEGRRYRVLEREIANTPGTFFFCCLLYADDTDFPAAVELGVLRPDGLQVERFRNRFDL